MSHVEDHLRDVLNSVVKDTYPDALKVNITPISSNGANYSSALFKVSIVRPKEIVEIFAKVANLGQEFSIHSKYIFDSEKFIYTAVSSAYEKIQDKHGLEKRYVFPKYYKSNIEAAQIIIMENLAAKGYECLDRFKCIDWKYAAECVETLARYHALSLALKAEYPDVFKQAGEMLNLPHVSNEGWSGLTDGALAAVDETDRDKLSQLLGESVDWDKVKDFYEPRNTAVIIHGDYRASNLLHKEVNGELHVIPVDYQTARLGCPAADLIYFIVMGTDQHFRRQYYHQLVDFYYEQLAMVLRKLDLVPEEVYGKEEFETDMKEKLPIGICVAAMILPFVLVEAAHAPKMAEGQYIPRTNELFAERFRDLMHDFQQWGFI